MKKVILFSLCTLFISLLAEDSHAMGRPLSAQEQFDVCEYINPFLEEAGLATWDCYEWSGIPKPAPEPDPIPTTGPVVRSLADSDPFPPMMYPGQGPWQLSWEMQPKPYRELG